MSARGSEAEADYGQRAPRLRLVTLLGLRENSDWSQHKAPQSGYRSRRAIIRLRTTIPNVARARRKRPHPLIPRFVRGPLRQIILPETWGCIPCAIGRCVNALHLSMRDDTRQRFSALTGTNE